jgi:hypothetical protein
MSPPGEPPVLHGVAVMALLNLPWYVAFGPGAGHWEHVPPLIGMRVVSGRGFGVVRKKAA